MFFLAFVNLHSSNNHCSISKYLKKTKTKQKKTHTHTHITNFSLFVSTHLEEDSTPSPPHNTSNHWSHVLSGGYPSDWSQVLSQVSCSRSFPVPGRGSWCNPQERTELGYPLARTGLGYPQPGQEWGIPSQDRTGYPLARTGWGTRHQDRTGLHGRRYASCLHAGLSCFKQKTTFPGLKSETLYCVFWQYPHNAPYYLHLSH